VREYGKISPQFWIGKTGKELRGHPEAQIVALYLMTSPHAEMTGVFYCPVDYIAKETGLGMEGATKGLQRVIEAQICSFEAESETVFVHEMAKYQIGAELKETDNRITGVQKIYAGMPDSSVKRAFYKKYALAFFLPKDGKVRSPSKAPSKPETETETETETKGAFEQFWEAYPKKRSKGQAEKAWEKINPDDELLQTILNAVEGAAQGADWLKNNGQFIPHPATWLNAKGWLDGEGGGAKPWET
jgi:hypothetical protein